MARAETLTPTGREATTTVARRRRMATMARRAAIYAVLVLGILFVFTPVAWTVASSLRPDAEIFRNTSPVRWAAFFPTRPTLEAYRVVLFDDGFVRYIGNSLFVSGTVVVLGLIINAFAAYAFARFRFPGRDLLFVLVLITFMIPFETIVVPLYLLVDDLGWIDTYQGLIVPGLVDAVAIFLLRQFFLAIPKELEEAALLDGANPARIFRDVILPLSVPALITAGLSMFVFQWNAFFWPLVATRSEEMRVVQVGVSLYVTQIATDWSRMFAASVLSSLPPVILYVFFQRYYLQTISSTGFK